MHKLQVRKFYEVLWDDHNKEEIASVLHENFTFRGSLGQEKKGHKGFSEYVDMVHNALGDYKCIIEELIEEENKVFAKMSFTGIHKAKFLNYEASHKRVTWKGCALFTFKAGKISDLWVLGDLKNLENQLNT